MDGVIQQKGYYQHQGYLGSWLCSGAGWLDAAGSVKFSYDLYEYGLKVYLRNSGVEYSHVLSIDDIDLIHDAPKEMAVSIPASTAVLFEAIQKIMKGAHIEKRIKLNP